MPIFNHNICVLSFFFSEKELNLKLIHKTHQKKR